jgi:hypothetical protein
MSEHEMDERDPRVSRAYREEAHLGPGKALDARILAAAREAASQTGPRRGWWRRFAVPVSAVAVAVVATTLALLMEQEAQHLPDLRETAPQSAPVREEPHEPSGDMDIPGADGGKTGRSKAAPVQAPAPQSAPVAGPARSEVPVPAPAAPPAESADRVGPEAEAREWSTESAVPAAPGMSAKPPAVMSVPAGREAGPAGKAEGSGIISPRSLGKAQAESPEAMVERIRMLQREGRDAEAQALLDELQRSYPDFPLPEDLR